MDFLLELGLEEIPARMIDGAREELARRVGEVLARERLLPEAEPPKILAYSTPRRLALIAHGLLAAQPDAEEVVTGPAIKVAYKDGQPTAAAEAFSKKVNVAVSALGKTITPKGEYVSVTVARKGRPASEVLAEALPKELRSLYWAKNMYWRGKAAERFVRPVRWLVALLDSEIVPLEFAGVKAGKVSRGHRILGEEAVKIGSPAEYQPRLEAASVIVAQCDREHRIRKALDASTRAIPGARWRADDALKETVVNLTEFPSAVLGNFDPEFLSLPEEVLVTVMRDHQKYFAVDDEGGKLAPHFLAVLNTDGDPEGLIRHGNERVLRARFNDARFFWQNDQRMPLSYRVDMLLSVTFQKDLGDYHEKSTRIEALAQWLVSHLSKNGSSNFAPDAAALREAARLAKTDLTTELVKEFTELQGIVGGLYARAQGASATVADAIYDQYRPASIDAASPRTLEGALLSIADKADSIAGMFLLGLQPTGSKDPFALRRQANGIVKTIAEHAISGSLREMFSATRNGYNGSEAEKKFPAEAAQGFDDAIGLFFRERLEFYMRESQGIAYDEINAVLAAGSDDVNDALIRARAVASVRKAPGFEHLATAFKRIKNILRQARESGANPAAAFDSAISSEPAEQSLATQVASVAAEVARSRSAKSYDAALRQIATLRPALDTFFEKVMVMVEDEGVRSNRLALLASILHEFTTIADFSEISAAEEGRTQRGTA